MRRIRKFFALPREERRFFIQAIFFLVSCRFWLHFKTFKNVINTYSTKAVQQYSPTKSNISPTRSASLLETAAKVVPFTTCLSKALAGSVLFSSQGHRTKLHIGVTKEKSSLFEAHAWLSLDGCIIVGYQPGISRYQELPFQFINEAN